MIATLTPLTNRSILLLHASLFALDGKPASSNGTPATFKFKGTETRLAIVKNFRALTSLTEELQEERTKMRIEHLGTADPIENEHKHPAHAALEAAWLNLMRATQEVPLVRIPYGDLKAEDNGIAPSSIAALVPHIVVLDD